MSKNWKFGNIGNDVTLALPVTAGAAGDVVPIGSEGLAGYLVTDRGTEDGPNAVGITEGYASVRLLPAQGVIELEVTGDNGDAVFATVDGTDVTYSTSNSASAIHVGHIVTPDGHTPQANHAFVYLGSGLTIAASGG